MLDPGDLPDGARHDPAVVQEQHDVLVALGPKLLDDRALQPDAGGPVDAPRFVIGPVVAQLIELRAAAFGAGSCATHSRRLAGCSAVAAPHHDSGTRASPGSHHAPIASPDGMRAGAVRRRAR